MDEKLVEKLSLLKTEIINSKEYQEFIDIEKKSVEGKIIYGKNRSEK